MQLRKKLRLALEPLSPLGALDKVLGQDFDRDDTIETRVRGSADLTRTASTRRRDNLVVVWTKSLNTSAKKSSRFP